MCRTIILKINQVIAGFTTSRRCQHGCKIGPLSAADDWTARRLADAAMAALRTDHVVFEVQDASQALATRLTAAEFDATFRTARMYRGIRLRGQLC